MPIIEHVHAREVFDSRGKPTVEVEITCEGGQPSRAIVPSGASTGRFEAVELRDGDRERLRGTGVQLAVASVCGEIAGAVRGMDADDQEGLDSRLCDLDGTGNKNRLGANAILGTSLAAAYAAANAKGIPAVRQFAEVWDRLRPTCSPPANTVGIGEQPGLPLPMVNMISGGLHAGGNLDFQDYLILPIGATSYRQAFEWIVSVYWQVGTELNSAGFEGSLVGDEGGFGPKLESNEQALGFVVRAIEAVGLNPGTDVAIGLDVASSHFYEDGAYQLSAAGNARLSSADVTDLLESWCDRFPIISIEDGLAEDDWDGWKLLTERLGKRVQLVGDDLFVTNKARLQEGIDRGVANSVLIKFNQIGTLWETLQTMRLAIDSGYWPVVSARSGETEDTTIADLVVATGGGQLKVGSVARSERLAKYNQLLRLEEQLGPDVKFAGVRIFEALQGWSAQ